MANKEHLKTLRQGVEVWNHSCIEKPDIDFNLVQPEFSGATLQQSDLIWANVRGANLRGARLSGANLCRANLGAADLSGAAGALGPFVKDTGIDDDLAFSVDLHLGAVHRAIV